MTARERDWRAAYEAKKALTDRLTAEHAAERHELLVRIADLRSAMRGVIDAWSEARAEILDLLKKASEVPGLSAALDEARGVNVQVADALGLVNRPEGQGGCDVAPVEMQIDRIRQLTKADALQRDADALVQRIGRVLKDNGCGCDCGHHYMEHSPDCVRCLACKIEEAIQ